MRLINHTVKGSTSVAEPYFNQDKPTGQCNDLRITSAEDNLRRLRKQANFIRGGFCKLTTITLRHVFWFSNSKRPVLLIDVRIRCFEQVVKAKTKEGVKAKEDPDYKDANVLRKCTEN